MGCASVNGVCAQTLGQVVRSALPTHPRLEEVRYAIRAAEADIEVSQSAWNLRLQADGAVGRQQLQGSTAVHNALLTPALRLRKLVYDGGRTQSEVELRESRVEQALAQFQVSETDLALSLAEAYVQVARAKEALMVTKAWVSGLLVIEDLTREIQKIDRGRQVDLSQAISRSAQARSQQVARQAGLAEAVQQLNELAGMAVSTESSVTLARELGMSGLDEALLAAHPRVRVADTAVRVAHQQVALDSLYKRPRFDIEGYVASNQDATGRYRLANTVGVQLVGSHTFLDGGGGAATVKASGLRQAQAEAAVGTARRDVRTNYARWLGAEEDRQARQRSYQTAYEEATRLRGLMGEQFRAGRRPILDLLSQESEIYQAALGVSTEKYDAILNHIRLAHGAGQLLEALDVASGVPTVTKP
jgi:outer membrane protein TolC